MPCCSENCSLELVKISTGSPLVYYSSSLNLSSRRVGFGIALGVVPSMYLSGEAATVRCDTKKEILIVMFAPFIFALDFSIIILAF